MELVTGYRGKAHITPEKLGRFEPGIFRYGILRYRDREKI